MAYAYADFTAFKHADMTVSYCSGPGAGEQCPLTADGGHCELADAADIVLFGLGVHEPRHREVLDAHRRQHPETPVVVEVPRGTPPPDAPGCRILPWPATVAEQLRVLEEELNKLA